MLGGLRIKWSNKRLRGGYGTVIELSIRGLVYGDAKWTYKVSSASKNRDRLEMLLD